MFRQSRDCPLCQEPMAPVHRDGIFICMDCDHREPVDPDNDREVWELKRYVACDYCQRTIGHDDVTYSIRGIRCHYCTGDCR